MRKNPGIKFNLISVGINSTLLGLIMLILAGCEPGNLNLSCDNCYTEKPAEGILFIDFAPVSATDRIPVTVYEGKLESGRVILRDTVTSNYLDIWVPVGHFYTVVAEYTVDSTLIRAVDGDRVSIYLDETNCSEPCWRARDGKADCRLRK